MTFFEEWINREKKRDRDHPIVVKAYKHVPVEHTPIIMTVENPLPYQEKDVQSLLVITVPPLTETLSQLNGYLPTHDMFVTSTYNDKPITLTYITINNYVEQFLEGNIRMMTQFNPRMTRIMYTGQFRLGNMVKRLREYMMSRQCIEIGLSKLYLGLSNLKISNQPQHLYQAARLGYELAVYNYIGKEGRVPTDHLIATKYMKHVVFDDFLMGRWDLVKPDDFISYLKRLNEIYKRTSTTERGLNRMRSISNIGYVMGSIYQIHQVFAK